MAKKNLPQIRPPFQLSSFCGLLLQGLQEANLNYMRNLETFQQPQKIS